jgi:ferredoxin
LSQLAIVDPVKCVECEACMEACMHGAITFVEMGVKKTNGG